MDWEEINMDRQRMSPIGQKPPNETKTRIPVWLYPSTLEALDLASAACNCKSRSEFIERAIQFYAGYISGQDANKYLPPALVSAMRGTIQDSEDRICRLLFKLAVEMDMMMNVLAAGLEIPEEQIERLRPQCVRNVKRTGGSVTLQDAIHSQTKDQ